MSKKKEWVPEIMYQEDSILPFIEIPEGQKSPDKLFIWMFERTGEFEPGVNGEDVPIFNTDMGLFFSYNTAKKVLSPVLLDQLRVAFGLEPLHEAEEKGKSILEKVDQNVKDKNMH